MESLAKQFDNILLGISNNLRKHGINKKLSESNFAKLPLAQQQQVLKRSSLQLEQMELLDPALSVRAYINTICRFHRLKPINESIYEKLSGDTLWEILDLEFNQIYRSKLIYKFSDYSVTQMEEGHPFELYDRPKKILEQLIEAFEIMKNKKDMVEMSHIKPYILKELKSNALFMFQVQHRFNCPLVDIDTGEVKAFIASFDAIKLSQARTDADILLMN